MAPMKWGWLDPVFNRIAFEQDRRGDEGKCPSNPPETLMMGHVYQEELERVLIHYWGPPMRPIKMLLTLISVAGSAGTTQPSDNR